MKKKVMQKATYSKTMEVPWVILKSKIDEYGVDKVYQHAIEIFDDDSVAYTVRIHLKPEKGGKKK